MNHFDQEKASNRAQDQSGEDFAPPVLPWLRATLDDLNDFDFEGPVATSQSADSMELSDLFRVAAGPVGEKTELPDTPSAHIFAMLWAVTGMHFKPREPNEPFGAAFVAPDADDQRCLPTSAGHLSMCWRRWPSARSIQSFALGSPMSHGCSIGNGARWRPTRLSLMLILSKKSILDA
jgi:hypothetical protein